MSFGIAFDIDGVLFQAGAGAYVPLPGARDVLLALNEPAPPHRITVPHVYLTNGTGTTEAGKAEQLRKTLNLPFELPPHQVVLASSPLCELPAIWAASRRPDGTAATATSSIPSAGSEHDEDKKKKKQPRVLVLSHSHDNAVMLARSSGFTNIATVQEFLQKYPFLVPVKGKAPGATSATLTTDELAARQKALELEEPFHSVLLYQSPEDWESALQICTDVLRSRDGRIAGRHNDLLPNEPQFVELHSGNPDFDYGALHATPRITLGAFRRCLEMVFLESTGRTLVSSLYGKPYPSVYDYARRLLEAQAADIAQRSASEGGATPAGASSGDARIARVYAVGDNPLSDIKGANTAGWHSILVRTGCFTGPGNHDEHPATHVCHGVKEALDWILSQERAQTQQ
ncbi:HAD-superfamily subfamily IIA hydrolase [Capsaspora owczarzaki ATCC 30864]|uniref:HAD-superfamily subfamily IIA hydrolase n=1 Tax=Capsaspora owczarzaki (strain ATCC 30864) TaxID=595528 RepID=A0A0D2WVJ9_CAPO3|nr:HAD-superfamily subfamily IIA hydrolase [Capsaspora owczarzaki ATCC 30864]KJE96243.1 HAD-superfamily subfamily IIA hydrolase [Capsaspora owczarzaki ATCC 30864]|eukprot:XP_004344218.1 HAD-superfamily subfamily IIA hydrolase [Capsaspora owczarzaki ATCC 30864]